MAYFNHAYAKLFLGTGPTRDLASTGAAQSVNNPYSTGGFITTPNTPSVVLANLPLNGGAVPHTGYFGFFDPNTYLSIDPTLSTYNCCPLILASSSVLQNDKIGPFHGGYQETNKSKMINPKYVQKAYWVKPCVPQQAIISIGNTPTTGSGVITFGTLVGGTGYTNGTYVIATTAAPVGGTGATFTVTVAGGIVTGAVLNTAGTGYSIGDVLTFVGGANNGSVTVVTVSASTTLDPNNFQGGTTDSQCCFEFLCGETYYLRVDVKGSPALRALNHNAYQTLDAYTGCCSDTCPTCTTPTAVDSTTVMIAWAKQVTINNYLKPFILPVVFSEAPQVSTCDGIAYSTWYAPGTLVDPISLLPVAAGQSWDCYPKVAHIPGACAGLRLFGAFVETKFGDCTFQVTDFFEKEPVKILASMVDYTGDPCVFEGICVYNDCLGLQGMGFGEQVVRDLILSESYLQNFFASNDLRIREITQGYDMTAAVNRNALYSRYFLLHSVPRWNNPTSTFDNDRYMNEIIVNEPNPLVPVGNTVLNSFLTAWLSSCANCVPFENFGCTQCVPVAN